MGAFQKPRALHGVVYFGNLRFHRFLSFGLSVLVVGSHFTLEMPFHPIMRKVGMHFTQAATTGSGWGGRPAYYRTGPLE